MHKAKHEKQFGERGKWKKKKKKCRGREKGNIIQGKGKRNWVVIKLSNEKLVLILSIVFQGIQDKKVMFQNLKLIDTGVRNHRDPTLSHWWKYCMLRLS